jgi:thiamine-monophosphate kinase
MKLQQIGEFNLIDRISNGMKLSKDTIKGIGDDAAVLKYTKDRFLVFTTDMLLEERHFYRKDDPYLVGRKALCVNISDIVAMGGVPKYAVISVGLPGNLNVKYADELYRGIKDMAKKYHIDLVGGDTICSEEIIINIALLGEVEKHRLVLRSGAKNGDDIFVTGEIGGSFKGRHLSFIPRIKESGFLTENFKVHSMIDISDGLLADLGHILKMSNAGAILFEKDIPISEDAENFESAVKDGEDFELVFTVSKKEALRLMKSWPFKTRISRIGKILNIEKGFYLETKDKVLRRIEPKGFVHF